LDERHVPAAERAVIAPREIMVAKRPLADRRQAVPALRGGDFVPQLPVERGAQLAGPIVGDHVANACEKSAPPSGDSLPKRSQISEHPGGPRSGRSTRSMHLAASVAYAIVSRSRRKAGIAGGPLAGGIGPTRRRVQAGPASTFTPVPLTNDSAGSINLA